MLSVAYTYHTCSLRIRPQSPAGFRKRGRLRLPGGVEPKPDVDYGSCRRPRLYWRGSAILYGFTSIGSYRHALRILRSVRLVAKLLYYPWHTPIIRVACEYVHKALRAFANGDVCGSQVVLNQSLTWTMGGADVPVCTGAAAPFFMVSHPSVAIDMRCEY